jgi:integrase
LKVYNFLVAVGNDSLAAVNLEKLRLVRDGLQRVARAPRTIKAYSSDWKLFTRWCSETGLSSLPCSADTLGCYVTWLLTELGRKVSTAERHASAVAHYHVHADYPSPLSRDVRRILASVKRSRKERPMGKAALDSKDLVRVAEACDVETNRGVRDRAMIVFGFATSLRRSELVRLQFSDIAFEERGIVVLVRSSKTDQHGRGRVLSVWAGNRPETDPVGVLHAWIERRGRWDGPLFLRMNNKYDKISRNPLSGEGFNEAIKRAIAQAGLDPTRYGAHSLRAGSITASADAGRSDQEIMNLSGHVNATVMRGYIRRARVFSGRNPLAGVM